MQVNFSSNNTAMINLNDYNRSNYLQGNQQNTQTNFQKKSLPDPFNQHIENSNKASAKKAKDVPISKETLTIELEKANQQLWQVNRGLEFNLHEETNRTYVKIINKDNNEVIKEIPPSQLLDVLAKIWTYAGILVDKKI